MSQGNDSASARSGRGRLRSHVLPLAVIFLVVAAAYLAPVLQGRVFYTEDTSDINYVMFRSHVEDLKTRGFTAWTPGLATGHYRAADPTYGIWSPLRLLIFLLVPGYNAQLAATVIYALIAGLGAYAFGLALAGRKIPALYLGVGFPLCGAFASMTLNLPYFTSAAWLPWLFAAGMGVKGPALRAALIALFAALIAADGDLLGSGIALLLLGAVTLILPETRESPARRLVDLSVLAGAAVLYLLLTAVIWWPALELLPESRRWGGLSSSESLAFSIHPLRSVSLMAPRFFGQAEEGTLWAPELTNSLRGLGFWHRTIYLGLITPVLWPFALAFSRTRRRAGALLIAASLLFLLSFGKWTPLLPWLFERIEPLRLFRFPAKLFMFASLLFIAASALGLGELERRLGSRKQRLLTALLAFITMAVLLAGLTAFSRQSRDAIRYKSPRPELAEQRVRQDLVRLGLLTAAFPAFIIFMGPLNSRRRLWFASFVIIFSAGDLLSSLPAIDTNPKAGLEDHSELIALVQELTANERGRVFVDHSMFKAVNLGPRPALRPNWGILDGVEYATGASASMFRPLFDLEDADQIMDTDAAMLRILAAHYLVTSLAPPPDWFQVLFMKGIIKPFRDFPQHNISLYVSARPHPRAFIVDSVQGAATRERALANALQQPSRPGTPMIIHLATDRALLGGRLIQPAPGSIGAESAKPRLERTLSYRDDEPDRVTVIAELEREGWLVCRDYAMTGWRAYVDGEETTIHFADGIGRAVRLPAGRHEVVFRFRPPGLRAGCLLSLAGAVLIVLLLVRAARRRPS